MKKRFIAWVLLVVIVICSACSSAPTEIIQSEDFAGQVMSEENSESLKDKDDEGIKYAAYKVKQKDYSLELLEQIFLKDKEIVERRESQSYDYDDFTDIYISCSDKSRLNVYGDGFLFTTIESRDYPLHYFYEEIKKNEVFPDGPEAVFPETDLDFMSLEEAKNIVKDYMDILEIDTENDWQIYPLEAEKFTQVIHQGYPDEEYERDIADGYSEVKRYFDKEDEAYFFMIPVSVDGNAITEKSYYETGLDYITTGSWIRVLLGNTGIWYMHIANVYEVSEKMDMKTIISDEDAVNAVNELYANTLGMGFAEVKMCEFTYIARLMKQAKRNEIEIVPAYLVTVEDVYEDKLKGIQSYEFVDIVDGFTGEVE